MVLVVIALFCRPLGRRCGTRGPKFFGRILDTIFPIVSSQRRRLKARYFAIISIFIALTTCGKTRLLRISYSELHE